MLICVYLLEQSQEHHNHLLVVAVITLLMLLLPVTQKLVITWMSEVNVFQLRLFLSNVLHYFLRRFVFTNHVQL